MIPFGSQRASGQDLATHLLNALDNERLELAHVRGAIARDLHGAFAEWEAQAHALTRCRKYLYSLSVNPDPRQGRLTREQYLDYIARVEERLGLTGQPRAIVFHEKHGREHCHVVWSRIDTHRQRAVQISYDREKLMAVTREFARDHGLSLPDGYYRDHDAPPEQTAPPSLYEKHQQDAAGLTKEERMAEVTSAWRRSDSAPAFVRALEELGYVLATGKRDYVLVDRYGHMNALPKLIADSQVRTWQVRAFLGRAFPTNALPSVEEARAQAAQRRAAVAEREREQAHLAQQKAQASAQRAALELKQASRRQAVEQGVADLAAQHAADRLVLGMAQQQERAALRADYLAAMRRVRDERRRNSPTGLAAFLGRVTGMALITKKLRRYRDRQRYLAFVAEKAALRERQSRERAMLARHHELLMADLDRRQRALRLIERREVRALETAILRNARIRVRQEPAPKAPARPMDDRPASAFRRAWSKSSDPAGRTPSLRKSFTEAADGEDGKTGGQGDRDELVPAAEAKTRRRKRQRDHRRAFAKAARSEGRERSDDGSGGRTGQGDTGAPAALAPGPGPGIGLSLGGQFAEATKQEKKAETGQTDGEGGGGQGAADQVKPAADDKTRRRRKRRGREPEPDERAERDRTDGPLLDHPPEEERKRRSKSRQGRPRDPPPDKTPRKRRRRRRKDRDWPPEDGPPAPLRPPQPRPKP